MEDGVRIFEILSSEYLELSSDVAMKAHHKAIAVEFLSEGMTQLACLPYFYYTRTMFIQEILIRT